MTYRREFEKGLIPLARAFDIAAQRGAPRPVIVGGSAVEYYTGSAVMSGDFDLVVSHDEVVGEALLEVGFRHEDRQGHHERTRAGWRSSSSTRSREGRWCSLHWRT